MENLEEDIVAEESKEENLVGNKDEKQDENLEKMKEN